jgi:hypothetical protein
MKTKMKFYCLFGLIGIFILTSSFGVNAQKKTNDNKPQKSPQERTEIIVKKMTNKLLLSSDQVPKVHDIILEREKQKDLDIASLKTDNTKLKLARDVRNKKADDALKIVLTDKQFQELISWRKTANQKKNNKTDVGVAPDTSADDIDVK